MYKGSGTQQSPRPVSSWRGRFINGVWYCDCEPRLPADRFQTKNGGVNHGRWFYTCQKPQPKRCKFFLWESDAQVREKHTVLSNTTSEPNTPKKTPTRTIQEGGLLTPTTGRAHNGYRAQGIDDTPTKVRKTRAVSSDEDAYSWDDSLDDEVENLLEKKTPIRQPIFSPQTPKKAATDTSPGKRKLADTDDEPPPYSVLDTMSMTPTSLSSSSRTNTVPFSSVEVSTTPTPRRYQDVLSTHASSDASELASSVLSILDHHDVVVPTEARDELVALLDKHHLQSQGVLRGRDISRVALKKKNEEIQALKERIEGLEAEREMNSTVIAGLRPRSIR